MSIKLPSIWYSVSDKEKERASWEPVDHYDRVWNLLPDQFKKNENFVGMLFSRSSCYVLVRVVGDNNTYEFDVENEDGSVSQTFSYTSVITDDADDIIDALVAQVNAAGIGLQAFSSEQASGKFYVRSDNPGEVWEYSSADSAFLAVRGLGIVDQIVTFEEIVWQMYPSVLMFYPEKWGAITNIQASGGEIQITSPGHGLAEVWAAWQEGGQRPMCGIAHTSLHNTEGFVSISGIVDDDNFTVSAIFQGAETEGVWIYPGDVKPDWGRSYGSQLDLAGKILNAARLEDEFDTAYIIALMAKVACDSSSGTWPDLLDAISKIYPNASFSVSNVFPAKIQMQVIGGGSAFNPRIEFMRNTQPTGVGLEINFVGSANPFRYALAGPITLFTDAGAGYVTVSSEEHGLSNGDTVEITLSGGYDGSYVVSNITDDTFDIFCPWVYLYGSYGGPYGYYSGLYYANGMWLRTARADGMGGYGDSEGIYTDGGAYGSVWVSY